MQREVKHSSSKNNIRHFRLSQNLKNLRSLRSSLRLIQQLKQRPWLISIVLSNGNSRRQLAWQTFATGRWRGKRLTIGPWRGKWMRLTRQ